MAGVHLDLRWLSGGLALFALAALTLLIVSTNSADALATVALGLAVLAFLSQLLIFGLQLFASNDQQTKARDLHSDMKSVLAAIEERTQGTERTVQSINEKLLQAILEKALPGASATTNEDALSPEFAQQVAAEVASAVATSQERSVPPYPRKGGTTEDATARALLTKPLTDAEFEAVRETLDSLSTPNLLHFGILARDEWRSRRPGSIYGPGLPGGRIPALDDTGLVETFHLGSREFRRLTEKGRNAARVVYGQPRANTVDKWLRRRLAEHAKQDDLAREMLEPDS